MIDIRAARESYEKSEFEFLGWIESQNNLADGFTKLGHFQALVVFLTTNKLDIRITTVVDRKFVDMPLNSDEDSNSTEQKMGECENINFSVSSAVSDDFNYTSAKGR